MFEIIFEALKAVWDFIKKIFVKILNFFKNIISWFRDPDRLKKLQEDSNVIAVSIKEKLDNGNYAVINCLFDQENNELVDYTEDAEIIESEQLDKDSIRNFGDKDMIVLR